jgi:hypothetical protein
MNSYIQQYLEFLEEFSRDVPTKPTKPSPASSDVGCVGFVGCHPEQSQQNCDSWPPRSQELATWPIQWRERWGRLAGRLEDKGHAWQDAERISFEHVARKLAKHEATHGRVKRIKPPAAPAGVDQFSWDDLISPDTLASIELERQLAETAAPKKPLYKPEEPQKGQPDRRSNRPHRMLPDRPHAAYRPPHQRPAWKGADLPRVGMAQECAPFNEF